LPTSRKVQIRKLLFPKRSRLGYFLKKGPYIVSPEEAQRREGKRVLAVFYESMLA
jgi:hypothetical protein